MGWTATFGLQTGRNFWRENGGAKRHRLLCDLIQSSMAAVGRVAAWRVFLSLYLVYNVIYQIK